MDLLLEAIQIRENEDKINKQIHMYRSDMEIIERCQWYVSDPNLSSDLLKIIKENYRSINNLKLLMKRKYMEYELNILELEVKKYSISSKSIKKQKLI